MVGEFRGGVSTAARIWLLLWIVMALTSAGVVFQNPGDGWIRNGEWQNRDLAVLVPLAALLLFAVFMHTGDTEKWRWTGFRYVHKFESGETHTATDPASAGAILTVESVRAALTVGLLAIVLQTFGGLAKGLVDGTGFNFNASLAFSSPRHFYLTLVLASLSLSLVLTLAAVQCNDYSVRFDWKADSLRRLELRRKAFDFDRWGFYCLMWPLPTTLALIDRYLAILAASLCYFVMWKYYFFKVRQRGRGNEGSSTAVGGWFLTGLFAGLLIAARRGGVKTSSAASARSSDE